MHFLTAIAFSLIADSAVADVITLPIDFHVIDQAYTQSRAKEDIRLANEVWKFCDIRVVLASYKLENLADTDIEPSETEIQNEIQSIYQALGIPIDDPRVNNVREFATLSATREKIDRLLLNSQGSKRFVVPVIIRDWNSAVTLASFPKSAYSDIFYNSNINPPIESTTGIVYGSRSQTSGYRTERFHVLSHELGHFFGLEHEKLGGNVMGFETNKLLPRQCAYARNFLKKKQRTDQVLSDDGRDCREKIGASVCDASTDKCGIESGFADRFLEIYDQYPPDMKKLMCSIDKFEITSGMTSAGEFASPRIKINADFLKKYLRVSDFLTWKDRLSFGGSKVFPENHVEWPLPQKDNEALPEFSFRIVNGSNDWLLFTLTHELGHALDLKNGLQKDWQRFSWTDLSTSYAINPKPEFDFPRRADACYYFCGAHSLSLSDVFPYFDGLFRTGFVTGYAALDSLEDFADSFAVGYLVNYAGLDEALPGEFVRKSNPSGTYPPPLATSRSLESFWNSKIFSNKRVYLENVSPF